MKTKIVRKNKFPSLGGVRGSLLLLLLSPAMLMAQQSNGIEVTGLAVESGTVTFGIRWEKANMPALWSDTVWVFVDHNVNGTMVRLPLVAGSTLTGTSALGVGQVKDELASGNDQGVWVIGNARVANTFSATVTLLTSNQNVSGACVYASNYPPVGTFLSTSTVSFTGMQPFNLVLRQISGSGTISGSSTDGYYYMPGGYELKSFTDKTGAPGTWSCLPMTGAIDFSMQPASIAKGQSATFTVTTHPSMPNAAAVTYTWDAPGFDPASFSGAYNASYKATAPNVAGPSTVTLTARSTNYCDRELKKSVTVLDCYPSDIHTLTVSATEYCAGTTVTFALSNTTSGRKYRLYKGDGSVMNDLAGTGSAATFTGTFAGGGVYTAQVLAEGGNCGAVMTGSHVVTERNLPTQPTIAATDVCFNGGDLVFTASGHSGVVEWVSFTGGGTVSGNSATFANGAATGTKTVVAKSAQTYSTLTCYSAEVTKSANVNPLPTVASVAGDSRCGTGTVTINATPSNGAVIDWYGVISGGTTLTNGLATNSFTTPSIDASTTYYAQARIEATGCVSAAPRTAVLATVLTPPTAPTGLSSNVPTICNGISTSATLTANGGSLGSGAVYEWGTGATVGSSSLATTAGNTYSVSPSAATTYWVRLKGTAACSVTTTGGATTSVGVYSSITAGAITTGSATTTAGTNPNVTIESTTPDVSGGSGSFTYEWRRTGTSNATLTGSSATYTIGSNDYSTAGTYYFNRYAKDATCTSNTEWLQSSNTYTLYVKSPGPSGTVTSTLCTQCCWSGSTWVDCYVTTNAYPFDNASTNTTVIWSGNSTNYYSGARSDRDGRSNTNAISSTGTSAMQLCKNLGSGWYLPAYEELENMSAGTSNTPLNGRSGANLLATPRNYYWSSTEYYNNGGRMSSSSTVYQSYAVVVHTSGGLSSGNKTGNLYVRCAWQN